MNRLPAARPRRITAAKRDLFEMFDHITLLAGQARARGIEPAEVWLGPPEAETVRRGIESDPGFYRPLTEAARGGTSIEGGKIAGLVVRFSARPGIRVGATLSSTH